MSTAMHVDLASSGAGIVDAEAAALQPPIRTEEHPTTPVRRHRSHSTAVGDAFEESKDDRESPSEFESSALNDAANDFSPVLSKSARRKLARKMGQWRAEEAQVRAQQQAAIAAASVVAPMPTPPKHKSHQHKRHSPPSFAFRSPPTASHMEVHRAHDPISSLREMFPELDAEIVTTLYHSLGTFDAVVEYMLAADIAQTREDKQMREALNASIISASPELAEAAALAFVLATPPPRFDRLSALSTDLLFPICEFLDLFELCALAGSNAEMREVVDQVFNGGMGDSGPCVDTVDFGKNRFQGWSDWRMLRMIGRFPSINKIYLRNTSFKSFECLHQECFGRTIRALSFAGCHLLEDHHLHELCELGEHLTSLDLSGTEITDDGLDMIATARQNRALEKLMLTEAKFITGHGVARVLDKCFNLKHLDLRSTNIDKTILSFTQQHSQLQTLNLASCRKLPKELAITSKFCRLTALNLSANTQLAEITLTIPTLTQLNLGNLKSLKLLTLYTPKLALLNLNMCVVLARITTSLAHSDVLVTRLRELNANGCRSLTGLSFQKLLQSSRSTLRSLQVRGCLHLNDSNLELLMHPESDDHESAAPITSSSSSSSSPPPEQAELFSLDLSGCKGASASVILALQRQVAAQHARREVEAQLRAEYDAVPVHGRHSFGSGAAMPHTFDTEIWPGGLDDVTASPLEDSPSPSSEDSPEPLALA